MKAKRLEEIKNHILTLRHDPVQPFLDTTMINELLDHTAELEEAARGFIDNCGKCAEDHNKHFDKFRTRITDLEAALKPFAEYAKVLLEKNHVLTWPLKMADFEQAAKVLGKVTP